MSHASQPASDLGSLATGPSTLPLLEETIGANLDATAARFGDHEALVEVATARRWTYADLVADVDRLARGFLSLGIGVGDRVGIWAPNCAAWVLTQYATAKIGAILVNVNPAYRTHEVAYVIQQAGISVMVMAETFKASDYPAMVAEVADGCPTLRTQVVIDGPSGTPSWREPTASAARSWPGWRRASPPTTPSTSSTPPARRASPRGRRSATATSSTTATSWARGAATPTPTGSASRCPSTTASGWSWATSPRPATAPAS